MNPPITSNSLDAERGWMTMIELLGPMDVDRPGDGDRRTISSMATPMGMDDAELCAVAVRLDSAPAEEIVEWAVSEFGGGLSLAASFQDCVLIDIATRVDASIDVVFLDTHFHFDETMAYADDVRRRYGLRLRVMDPTVPLGAWPCGTEGCCQMRKVDPLDRALDGRPAWMSGLRRVETRERLHAPVVAVDARRGIVKINPLATWTDDQVEDYVSAHDLPVHPLKRQGYPSIGCAPMTTRVEPGLPPRSGRWAGSVTTECGIHQ
ncbi:MAG TPA: phosphoadenylyl-sulfate reductase [Acidimicrobiales bacterium]